MKEHVSNSNQQHMFEDISIKPSSKNMDKNKFIKITKTLFGKNLQEEFPRDFDIWSVEKQYNWINQNITKLFPNVPQSLLSFIPAVFCQLEHYDQSPDKLPEWMDIDKYRKGQKFVQEHYAALIISVVIGLIYIYSFDEGLKGVILGEHSHTPYLGFRRYLSTLTRIHNWYSGDPWIKGTKAYKDMQVTRRKHLAIRSKINQMSDEQIATACTFANPWCLDRELLLKDFAACCPSEKFEQRPYVVYNKLSYNVKGINNADFATTQISFLILPLLYPQNVGIYDATDEDLEGFCHMWKCYGYFLGMDDEYNVCRGSLEEIKQRMQDFCQYWIIQNFKELTPEWEHMTRCLVVPLNYYPLLYIPYKVMILISTDILNLNMPHLYGSLNYIEWITYKFYKFMFYTMKFSSVRTIINIITRKVFDKATNYNTEKLAKIQEKLKKLVPDFSLM